MGVPGDGRTDVGGKVSPSDLSDDLGWPAVAMVSRIVAFVAKGGEPSIATWGTDVGNVAPFGRLPKRYQLL